MLPPPPTRAPVHMGPCCRGLDQMCTLLEKCRDRSGSVRRAAIHSRVLGGGEKLGKILTPPLLLRRRYVCRRIIRGGGHNTMCYVEGGSSRCSTPPPAPFFRTTSHVTFRIRGGFRKGGQYTLSTPPRRNSHLRRLLLTRKTALGVRTTYDAITPPPNRQATGTPRTQHVQPAQDLISSLCILCMHNLRRTYTNH